MTEYEKPTDEMHRIELESKIVHAFWIDRIVCVGEKAELEVWTHFVGTGSDIEITAVDNDNKTVDKIKGKVYGDYFGGAITAPDKPVEEMTLTAKLPEHNLELKSDACRVIPKIGVTNQKWGQKEARRGDVVEMTADVQNITDGTQVMLIIYEYDRDSAHDFITKFPCRIKNNKIEAQWEYEYHEDTDEIPTDDEMQGNGKPYNPPEYFWVVDYHGKRFGEKQESGFLEFKDYVEINLAMEEGEPLSGEEYILRMADGGERKGKLDSEGYSREENIPPGRFKVEFPNFSDFETDE